MPEIEILYEDRDIIVCVKPAGMASQPERSSIPDMVSQLKNRMAQKREGNRGKRPYIGIVHRLDKPVGGIMVYAKNPAAAAGLSRQFSGHEVQKTYLAVLTGGFLTNSGILENRLERDSRTNKSFVTASGGKTAKLSYWVLGQKEGRTLVEIHLHTGRHHQIRVQMAYAGAGVYGDMKYNFQGTKEWNDSHGMEEKGCLLALFSSGLIFRHPATGERMAFKVLPETLMTIDEWPGLSYYMNNENVPMDGVRN